MDAHEFPWTCMTMVPCSRLSNGGEICIWRLVPPVGHCNTLYVGSVNWCHRCSSQEDPHTLGSSKYKYYVLHLSNEPFPKNVSDLEVVKNELFPLLYPDFNAWKKVGSYSAVQDNTVMQLLPTFFQTLNSGYMGENQLFLTPSKSLTLLGNDSF